MNSHGTDVMSHGVPSDPSTLAVDELTDFIQRSPSPFHTVANAAKWLDINGFQEYRSGRVGENQPNAVGRRYARFGGALVAWNCRPVEGVSQIATSTHQSAGFRILGAHTDSPNLRLRPRPTRNRAGWLGASVEVYGGALLNSWLDRDLGISGRLVLDDSGAATTRLVATDQPLFRVPQLAIHLDRSIRDAGLQLNPAQHVHPVWGHGDDVDVLSMLGEVFAFDPNKLLGFDLMLHDVTPPARIGPKGELLASARLDNQFSCWAVLRSLINESNSGDSLTRSGSLVHSPSTRPIPVVVLFDHEEVGSQSSEGANGPLLHRLLDEIWAEVHPPESKPSSPALWATNSVFLSVDMAHATHPNYPDRHDENHWILPGAGPAIKVNSNLRYASDGLGIAYIRQIAREIAIGVQVYSHRGDLPCGSTIGPIVASELGMATIDIGAPQLSMHSARELMAVADIVPTQQLLERFLSFDDAMQSH